tara:strand:+ start:2690 stop:5341 length:2652 start_codon:yes stop_codon:yes gene_type:complete
MNDNVYKIALAGFLHDIGKFAERASRKKSGTSKIEAAFYPDKEFLNNNMALYQPCYKGNYTHRHSVYTAAFVDHIEKLLPKEFNSTNWGMDDPLINLAAGHHKPETSMQWIIAIADRVSSGFDRAEFEDYNNQVRVRDYKKTRLLTIFEGIAIDEIWKKDNLESFRFRYPLRELTPENIFAKDKDEYQLMNDDQASREYEKLFFDFVDALEKLEHKQNIPLWFEHFDSLFMIYTSHIPAATVGKVVPDVSLYDHSKTTAALASSIYLYHLQNNTMEIDKIKDYEDKKFLIISGDFYGIQNFIFTTGGSTNKAAAKLLRGRSFAVSLLSELAADMLCREIGLTTVSIVLNAAGKFTLIAPNIEKTKNKIKVIEDKINDWLVSNFYGESSIGISFTEASCKDFVSEKFSNLWDKLGKELERKKSHKINLEKHGGVIEDYLDRFNNDLDKKLCPFCGKRPSSPGPEAEGDKLLDDDKSACKICRDHIYIGTYLVKASKIAITKPDAEIYGYKLMEPIFGQYQLSLDVTGKLSDLSQKGVLLKYWDISIPQENEISKRITTKFINGYVPKYAKDDETEEMMNRLLHGNKSEMIKNELFDAVEKKSPKTFHHLAKMALNKRSEKPDKFCGIEAIGALKADVDNLGLIFSCGLKRLSLSRLATLSRQMNYYFAIFIPYVLSTKDEFKNIYTVFTGGDDLYLIGPWNRIIDFSTFLNRSFTDYVCGNNHITISSGVSIDKPGVPVQSISERAEEALMKSKQNDRNSITLFDASVKWNDFEKLNEIKKTIESWIDNKDINKSMLYRLNTFIRLAKEEKEILAIKESMDIEDWECLKWKALFKYSLIRNVGKDFKGDQKEKSIKEVEKAALWLDQYKEAMRIPIWQIIYNQR